MASTLRKAQFACTQLQTDEDISYFYYRGKTESNVHTHYTEFRELLKAFKEVYSMHFVQVCKMDIIVTIMTLSLVAASFRAVSVIILPSLRS